MKHLGPKEIQFLAVIITVYIMEKAIPFSIGQPISIFMSTLFYYFIGPIAIYSWFALFSVDAIRALPGLIEIAKVFPTIINQLPEVNKVPLFQDPNLSIYLALSLYPMLLLNILFWFLSSRHIIKKFKILKIFGLIK